MDHRLMNAAEAGDIDRLYSLIHQNPYILEEVDRVPFVNTPLHMAVSARQIRFVKEIASLKPSFARKLNEDGESPIHLASTNGLLELVRELLTIGDDLCLLKGREKRTPLHSAAIAGRIYVLGELIKACPESLGELTIREETALHLSVRNNQYEAFKLLVELLKQINKQEFKPTIYSLVLNNKDWEALRVLSEKLKQMNQEDFVNWKDDEGNTALHLAASIKQRQMIEHLLFSNSAGGMVVDVNARNINNETALDVLLQLPGEADKREIEDLLRDAGVLSSNAVISIGHGHTHVRANISEPLRFSWSWATNLKFQKEKSSPNEVLVVAILFATETFQIGVSPPGGYWQDDYNLNPINTTLTTTSLNSHTAGTPIASTQRPVEFTIFMIFNFLGFLMSVCLILILTKGFPLRPLLVTAQCLIICIYASSLSITMPKADLLFAVAFLLLLLIGVLTLRFTPKIFCMIWNRYTGSEDGVLEME